MREILDLVENPVLRKLVVTMLFMLSLLFVALKIGFLVLVIITTLHVLEVTVITSLIFLWKVYGVSVLIYLIGYAVLYVYLYSKI